MVKNKKCIKCNNDKPATIEYFSGDKNAEEGIR